MQADPTDPRQRQGEDTEPLPLRQTNFRLKRPRLLCESISFPSGMSSPLFAVKIPWQRTGGRRKHLNL